MAAMRLQCGACDRDLPASAFHASAAKRRVYCCRACVSSRNREYHKSKQGAVAAALWATKHVLKSTWASHLRAKDVETALKLHGHRCFISGALLKPRQNGLACMLIPVENSGPDAAREYVPVLRSAARDVGYVLPDAFVQKYRRWFEATFKDVGTMKNSSVQGRPPPMNHINLPGARALEYLPPKMAEAMRRLCKPPVVDRGPRVATARPPPLVSNT